jgi:uncharacterized protein (TIGR03435 family)
METTNRSAPGGVQSTMPLVFLTLVLAGLASQSPDTAQPGAPPSFEVASIKLSAPPTGGPMFATIGMRPGGQWMSQNVQFISILRAAYPSFASPGQIVGGPDWINTQRFDINARAAGDPPREVVVEMLKQLLADRFKLKVHTEAGEVDVYALVLARPDGRLGPGLQKPAVDCEAIEAERRKSAAAGPSLPTQPTPPKPGERPQCGMLSSSMNGVQRVATGGTAISAVLGPIQTIVGRPVIDRTGLTGRFDIELQFAGTGPLTAADTPDAPASVFTAVQEQLGLKLESRKEKMDVLVIDQIEMPTPN